MSQGSLLAYFLNSHGRYATQAAAALHDVGADRLADVLRRASATYQAAREAWDGRRDELTGMREFAVARPYTDLPNADVLGGELTDAYWKAAEQDDWGIRLDAYIDEEVRQLAGTWRLWAVSRRTRR